MYIDLVLSFKFCVCVCVCVQIMDMDMLITRCIRTYVQHVHDIIDITFWPLYIYIDIYVG